MNRDELSAWVKEKREALTVFLVGLLLVVSILIGLMIRPEESGNERDETAAPPERVKLTKNNSGNGGNSTREGKRGATASFFLKPSPDEVLSLIKEMGEADLPAGNQKYTGLRVMWPVYFFQVLKFEYNTATVILDVSEDGFGAIVQTEIDTTEFPEIMEIERGRKIWVAGEIKGVEATGTGTINMAAEEVRFQQDLTAAIAGSGQANSGTGKEQPTKAEADEQ